MICSPKTFDVGEEKENLVLLFVHAPSYQKSGNPPFIHAFLPWYNIVT